MVIDIPIAIHCQGCSTHIKIELSKYTVYIITYVLKRRLTNTGVNIRPIRTSHLVPSMSPIVSVVTSHGRQNQL